MLTVVCWKWRPHAGVRRCYTADMVNALRRQVARHYERPHRFICATDDPDGLDPDIVIVPLWDTYADIPNPSNVLGPRCYRRLFAFAPEAAVLFGPRFVWLDLDCVITGNLVPVFDRQEDFVIWGNPAAPAPYNGSMVLMDAGCRRQVWDCFDPERSPRVTKAKGLYGSDQAWIASCLGPSEATWTERDGVYSFRRHVRRTSLLPADARIVFFAGSDKPWDTNVRRRNRWIAEHDV